MDKPIAALENDPASLPIAQAREEILNLLKDKDFLVVVGDTGSGKTTQLPAFLVAADDAQEDKSAEVFAPVAITQPRRVAATSVSQRVADERGVALGGDDAGARRGIRARRPMDSGRLGARRGAEERGRRPGRSATKCASTRPRAPAAASRS